MRLLITFASIYPVRSTFMVLALMFAGILEGVGLSMLLPLFGIAAGSAVRLRAAVSCQFRAGTDGGRWLCNFQYLAQPGCLAGDHYRRHYAEKRLDAVGKKTGRLYRRTRGH